ncbi:hypothetical protein [Ferruginibacter sp.]
MKLRWVLFITILLCVQQLCAQPPRRDTIIWSGGEWETAILRASCVSGQTPVINILPNRNNLCFDKQVKVKLSTGRAIVEQCLYFNTTDGYVSYLPPRTGAAGGLCDIKPDEKNFRFFVIGNKGNIFNYHNEEGKDGVIKYWVSTGNTVTHQYGMTSPDVVAALHKKTEIRTYCGGKIKAWAYKFDSSPTVYYLFGKNYPPDINVTSNKYLGNFGIGYQYTDKGLYMIMEMETSGSYDAKITDVDEVNTCFNPTRFQVQEDEFMRKRTEELQKEWAKIDREEAQIRSDDECAAQRENIIVFKKAQLRRQEENLRTVPQGNVYQDRNVQNAYLGMTDPLFMIQGDMLNVQLSICNAEVARNKRPADAPSYSIKINCLQDRLSQLRNAESRMGALNAQYAAQPARALAEKSKIYLQLMQAGGCN